MVRVGLVIQRFESQAGRDCRWGGGGGWMYSALFTLNTTTRCPWARHRTPQLKCLPTAPGVCSRCVCFTVCVCVCVCVCFGLVNCRAQILSMGHCTWPYVTSLSFTFNSRFKVQGFFICHIINYTGYNQKWNVKFSIISHFWVNYSC